MSKWNKIELENMLEDVVNELDLSNMAIEKHGQDGTAPAELVRLVLEQKDLQIRILKANEVKQSDKPSINNDALLGVSLPADKLIESLGECNAANGYELTTEDGEWWLTHKWVGSGEPLRQWLTGKSKGNDS